MIGLLVHLNADLKRAKRLYAPPRWPDFTPIRFLLLQTPIPRNLVPYRGVLFPVPQQKPAAEKGQ